MTYLLKRPSQRTAASEREARLATRIEVSCIMKIGRVYLQAQNDQARWQDGQRPVFYSVSKCTSLGQLVCTGPILSCTVPVHLGKHSEIITQFL